MRAIWVAGSGRRTSPRRLRCFGKWFDRFIEVLDCLDTSFIDAGLLDRLPRPGRLGAVRVGGIDINRPRARAVMQALLALSPNPAGFTSSELATKVARLLNDESYSPRRAAYDLRKFRCKGLAAKMPRSRRYCVDPSNAAGILSAGFHGSTPGMGALAAAPARPPKSPFCRR